MRLRSLATLVGSTLLTACSVVGVRSGTEQPKYDVIARPADGIEIRQYGERVAAEVTVSRGGRSANENSAFGALAGYIFGKNRTRADIAMTAPVETRASEKIAMTAPVQTGSSDTGMTMRFFLPTAYTVDTAPQPTNPKVRVVPVPPEKIATLQFTGLRSSVNIAAHTVQLLDRLEDTPWTATGKPVAYFYDPPWTVPALRRNEIAVRVEAKDG